jgi:hypothetical protein
MELEITKIIPILSTKKFIKARESQKIQTILYDVCEDKKQRFGPVQNTSYQNA